jgi:phosphatidylglycerophosphatase A
LHNESTINWVLQHQNLQDGGFIESNDALRQLSSSLISTYYAFKTIVQFDDSLIVLDEDVGMVEFNWIVFLIVLSVIGVAIGLFIYIRRRRKI